MMKFSNSSQAREERAGEESIRSVRFGALFALLMSACLLGGGPVAAGIPLIIISIAAAVCLGVLIYERSLGKRPELPRYFTLVLGAIWIAPLVQLIPLPPGIWRELPGRTIAASVRDVVSPGAGFYPFSIDPASTWVAFFAVTVFMVAFIGALSLGRRQMRLLLWALCAIAFLNIFVGSFQVATGGGIFDFHGSGHRANLIGFFANRNHAALYLSAMIPLLTYLISTSHGLMRRHARYFSIAGIILLLVGVVVTTSRAGLVMGMISAVASLVMVGFTSKVVKSPWRIAAGGGVLLLAASPILFSERLFAVMQRFDSVSADLRWQIWKQSWVVAQAYLPLGSGFGTYRLAYDPLEPIAMVSPQYVNNAHNDYLELLIEGGYPAIILLLGLLILIALQSWKLAPQIWKARLLSAYVPAILFIVLALGHSVVDYPMRRLAIAVPLALMLGLLFRSTREDRAMKEGAPTQIADNAEA
ncbi:O-antigen ligase family protein [Sphingopyxis kveilinensis]|uniref:O-antigen ligase family protein n=1 Tax=Sphingopyxis kveilinensis TaxID=3114367 RepID=UPI0030CF4157